MTTELSYRNEGANVYAQDGTLVCIAVDPLDAEVIAGLLRWKVDIHPEPAPEPDPWPTEPLIVASVDDGGPQLLSVLTTHSAATMTSAIVRRSESTLTNVVPVTVVPTERVDYLSAAHASWVAGAIDDRTMIGYAIGLLESLDELGVDL